MVQLRKVLRGMRAAEWCEDSGSVAAKGCGSWGVTALAPPPDLEVWRGLHQGSGWWLVGQDDRAAAELWAGPWAEAAGGVVSTRGACLGGGVPQDCHLH